MKIGSWVEVAGRVSAPFGFKASGVDCGIKPTGKDLALLYTEREAVAAAVFTTNQVKAAPVIVSKENLKASRGKARAIVANSGCANACTGKRGLEVARNTAHLAAKLLEIRPEEVIVASTGVIGQMLDFDKLSRGLQRAVADLSSDGINEAASAIMTTDRLPKICSLVGRMDGKPAHIVGIAKGAGMINPSLATMLAFIMTDVSISLPLLRKALRFCVERTFNAITVDGDTSTNDVLVVLANGAAGNRKLTSQGRHFSRFLQGLYAVCSSLAQAIVRDGEGATKFVQIQVKQAASESAARRIAKAIANSALVKTAIYGGDANWGRIICAAGYSGVRFDPNRAELYIDGQCVFRNGMAWRCDMARLKRAFESPQIKIELHLHQGSGAATVWTCDLSHEYVTINGSYRT